MAGASRVRCSALLARGLLDVDRLEQRVAARALTPE
jgi:hypothetical protein